MKIQDDEIRAIVAETLAEQHRLQQESIDTIVLKAVASVLASFGIEDEDRKDGAALFQIRRTIRCRAIISSRPAIGSMNPMCPGPGRTRSIGESGCDGRIIVRFPGTRNATSAVNSLLDRIGPAA